MFSGSFGVRSIVLCKCSGKVLIGYGVLYMNGNTQTKSLTVAHISSNYINRNLILVLYTRQPTNCIKFL